MLLTDNVSTLKNIGQQRLKKLNALGIFTVNDLIEHFPRDYIDRTNFTKISELVFGEENVVKCIVAAAPESQFSTVNGKSVVKLKLTDTTSNLLLEAVWFNQPYLKNFFKVRQEYIFTGRVIYKMGKAQMLSPEYESVSDEKSLSTGRIVPVYPSTDKLSQKMLRSLVRLVLDETSEQITEFLPEDILAKYNLCPRKKAVMNIHFPENDETYFAARKRLVFEELFLMQAALFNIKGGLKDDNGIIFNDYSTQRLLAKMPFSLTKAQNKVLAEIQNDFKSGYIMNRLIQGDVGSGKTAVAMCACFIAIQNGYQAALMAPTETLAAQHFDSFNQIFSSLSITTELLIGSLKKNEKNAIKRRLYNGDIQMLIGTHALIQDNVVFNNLAIVITDEQHRFGVRQRAKLMNKSENGSQKKAHALVMTATPIPRTLALILYGDLDISIIDELPPGRQKINTSAVNQSYRERIYTFIKKQIDAGRQAYIICPTIEQSETTELKAVAEYAQSLSETELNACSIGILHGKMKPDEKQRVMSDFSQNKISILVSTTVIEVGINVPNSTVMLIENAERFGLAQLHQLRGRVGRGSEQSYCILVTDSKSELTKQRTQAMVKTNDGFVISEMDLQLRGPGEFFGTMQHGLPEMHLANLYKDIDYLKQAQEAVLDIFQNKHLERTEIELLLSKINKKNIDINICL